MSGFVAGIVLVVAGAQLPVQPPAAIDRAPQDTTTPLAGPYQTLFIQPRNAARERLGAAVREHARAPATRAPKVVCGMVVVPADPQVDPKMIHRPVEPGPTYHIKRIPPAACAE